MLVVVQHLIVNVNIRFQLKAVISSVPMLVEQKKLVIESEAIFTHKDLCK